MPIVQSFGALQSMSDSSTAWAGSRTISLYGSCEAYATIYQKQPNVRTCVDFLARNIAQLGLHVFRRLSDTDRERLNDHELVQWLKHPNPATTRYRLIESLMGDLGIYFNAYWLKVRSLTYDGRPTIGLVRLPPHEMEVKGGLLPSHFVWTHDGRAKDYALTEVVHFRGYNPSNPLMGLSPLETLRRVLAEEAAAAEHRESYWRNAARFDGIIERPKDAPKWTPTQKDSWREQWQAKYAAGGNGVGSTAVLEDGMTFKPGSFSPKDSEYLAARKLSREECAAAYHIPLPMVGILEHATFSNIKEQHKQLYQDSLGPWLEGIDQDIEQQLLVECDDQTDIYLEFNIAEKMKGSFEEQATSLQVLVGRPIMTANEGRARLNLPSITDDETADQLAQQQGGPAATQPAEDPNAAPAAAPKKKPADDGSEEQAATARVLRFSRARQLSRLNKSPVGERVAIFNGLLERFNGELRDDLARIGVGSAVADILATSANADLRLHLESEEMRARVDALETRKPIAMQRTFDRDPENGLVRSFVDAPKE